MRQHISLFSAFLLTLTASAHAAVELPAIISDNMLLQANKPVAIWGAAAPGEKVTVAFDTQSVTVTADDAGKWKATLKPLAPDTAGNLTVTASNTLTVKNVLVGSVWICSGQSNMEFGIGNAHNTATVVPQANDPKLRLFTVPKQTALIPQTDVAGKWVVCTPQSVVQGGWNGFSAVGYFFGRELRQVANRPIGLIHTSWGGTPAQSWTSLSGLGKDPELHGYVENVQNVTKNLPDLEKKYQQAKVSYEIEADVWRKAVAASQAQLAAWNDAVAKAKAANQPLPQKPDPAPKAPNQPQPPITSWTPTSLYNAMIAPLTPYAIEGAIWYQGESNADRAVEYRTLFPRMISDWRAQWNQGDFPFLFVQLANFMPREKQPTDPDWAWLREAQTLTLKLPNTAMAVTIDIGQADDIHPKDKMDVGHRLALAAEKMVYAKNVTASGPSYNPTAGDANRPPMTVEGHHIRVRLTNTGTGLTSAAAPATQPNVGTAPAPAELKGFAIAGADKKWVWANATIDGDTLIVWSDQVAQPVAVRYAWANNPECNLYNKEGLPAVPFRTDAWPQAK